MQTLRKDGPFDPLLSLNHIAEATGWKRSKIYWLIQQKHLAAVKLCGSTRVPKSSLDAFLAANIREAFFNPPSSTPNYSIPAKSA